MSSDREPEATDADASEAASTEAEAATSPKKKRKKKRRARADEAQPSEPAPRAYPGLEADQVPAFALAFPEDIELDALVIAFEAGRYAEVRKGADKLIHATESDDVRKAAREIMARLEPDPIGVYLLTAAAALLAILAGWYWLHPHQP